MVSIVVEDQGPGIPKQEQNQLFVAFAKLSNKPTGGESSSGLGLAIVQRLMELQGGHVHYQTASIGGAGFVLRLQAA